MKIFKCAVHNLKKLEGTELLKIKIGRHESPSRIYSTEREKRNEKNNHLRIHKHFLNCIFKAQKLTSLPIL